MKDDCWIMPDAVEFRRPQILDEEGAVWLDDGPFEPDVGVGELEEAGFLRDPVVLGLVELHYKH